MSEEDLEKRKAIATETRKQFLQKGEKFEGHYYLHTDGPEVQGEQIDYNYFAEQGSKEKIYRIDEAHFVLPVDPTRVLNQEEFLLATCGPHHEGVRAYALYSKPRVAPQAA